MSGVAILNLENSRFSSSLQGMYLLFGVEGVWADPGVFVIWEEGPRGRDLGVLKLLVEVLPVWREGVENGSGEFIWLDVSDVSELFN